VALTVREYVAADGKNRFREWLNSLGNLGDHKSLGSGVWEARVMFGPGCRIYVGKDGDSIIVLQVGGDKGSQAKDISLAQGFWGDYLEAKRHGKAK
jgi:putative addiction module killer protein